MSATAETSPAIEQAKQYTIATKDRLLKTFSFVPDDKLNWVPVDSCRSALRIASHCGNSNYAFMKIIKGEPLPPPTPETMAKRVEMEQAITTREEAVALVEKSTAEVIALLDSLTPEQVASTVETAFMTMPMTFWMNLPGRHMDNHASQIDYIQTCWGDMDWHM